MEWQSCFIIPAYVNTKFWEIIEQGYKNRIKYLIKMLHSLGQTKKASETALTEKLFCKSFQNCLAGIMTSHNIDSG